MNTNKTDQFTSVMNISDVFNSSSDDEENDNDNLNNIHNNNKITISTDTYKKNSNYTNENITDDQLSTKSTLPKLDQNLMPWRDKEQDKKISHNEHPMYIQHPIPPDSSSSGKTVIGSSGNNNNNKNNIDSISNNNYNGIAKIAAIKPDDNNKKEFSVSNVIEIQHLQKEITKYQIKVKILTDALKADKEEILAILDKSTEYETKINHLKTSLNDQEHKYQELENEYHTVLQEEVEPVIQIINIYEKRLSDLLNITRGLMGTMNNPNHEDNINSSSFKSIKEINQCFDLIQNFLYNMHDDLEFKNNMEEDVESIHSQYHDFFSYLLNKLEASQVLEIELTEKFQQQDELLHTLKAYRFNELDNYNKVNTDNKNMINNHDETFIDLIKEQIPIKNEKINYLEKLLSIQQLKYDELSKINRKFISKILKLFAKIFEPQSISQAEKKLFKISSNDTNIELLKLYKFIESGVESLVKEREHEQKRLSTATSLDEKKTKNLLAEESFEEIEEYPVCSQSTENFYRLQIRELNKKWLIERERRKLDYRGFQTKINELNSLNESLIDKLSNLSL
ncbi:gamma-tubulin complex subunit SPC72 SCDLUD_003342 [Saccharomycodes ludwigii]|uniref:gamma-tubulin complex subunit SPC72 n=1 Tax=Saccharomycodes ludwigii TaxID=36035 RepID=UPI001E869F63|nr:hypothetical protein SCDLUD_003342 [Saccharomycodes ludwigii]KAH3900368.1 hypothetical protein SCDLUD_003342 [Saccharomycodes ludwigii]